MRKALAPLASLALLALLFALPTAFGLSAKGDATVTSLFGTADVRSGVQYPATFDGVRWDDSSLQIFRLGKIGASHWMAANDSGDLYFIVNASTEGGTDKPRFQGLIRWDGTSFDHLLQYDYGRGPNTLIQTGTRIRSVAVSPVSAGPLAAGQPVVLLDVFPEGGGTENEFKTEVWAVNDSVSPAETTFLHELSRVGLSAAIDESGSIYVSSGAQVQKLSFNGTNYDESTLATGLDSSGVALGPDGALYGLAAGAAWNQRKRGSNDILRIDPTSGTSSVHAFLSQKLNAMHLTTWTDDGRYWVSLSEDLDVISDVLEGETIGSDVPDRVVETGVTRFRDMTGAPDGAVFVAEFTTVQAVETEVFLVEPGAGSGGGSGGGGGGGKGGGKGKPK